MTRPRGRPPKFGKTMRQTAIWLPEEMIGWLKNQPQKPSEFVRTILEEKMNTELAWETLNDVCGTDFDAWRGMTVEQITDTLTKYSDHLIAEGQSGVDRIEDRAEAVYALINAE